MLRKFLSLLSDVAVYGASSLLGQLINFLLLPVYLAYIDPAHNGAYFMIMNVLMFFTPLTNLGMINAVFRRFNLEKDDLLRSQVLSSGLASVAAGVRLLLLVVGLACADHSPIWPSATKCPSRSTR